MIYVFTGVSFWPLAGLCNNCSKFDRKVAHGPWKEPVDFSDNPDHVILGLGLWLGRGTAIGRMCYPAFV